MANIPNKEREKNVLIKYSIDLTHCSSIAWITLTKDPIIVPSLAWTFGVFANETSDWRCALFNCWITGLALV